MDKRMCLECYVYFGICRHRTFYPGKHRYDKSIVSYTLNN